MKRVGKLPAREAQDTDWIEVLEARSLCQLGDRADLEDRGRLIGRAGRLLVAGRSALGRLPHAPTLSDGPGGRSTGSIEESPDLQEADEARGAAVARIGPGAAEPLGSHHGRRP